MSKGKTKPKAKSVTKKQEPKDSIFKQLVKKLFGTLFINDKGTEEVPQTAQQSIPYKAMYKDGVCKVTADFYSITLSYEDINYQLAQNEDKVSIFENYCDFLNYYDSSISVQLSFINSHINVKEHEKSIAIPEQNDAFNHIRKEYAQMLKRQLAKGNNGLEKLKFITLGIHEKDVQTARARLERIARDTINNFKVLSVKSRMLNGVERLELLHRMMNEEYQQKFKFDYSMIAKTGMSTKDFIAPTSLTFRDKSMFQIGKRYGSVNYLQILCLQTSLTWKTTLPSICISSLWIKQKQSNSSKGKLQILTV